MSSCCTNEVVMEFPCDFPIKVMGLTQDEFIPEITKIVQTHAPDFEASTLETRFSSKGTYLSITVTIRATSKEQLDALYLALTSHPMVKVVL